MLFERSFRGLVASLCHMCSAVGALHFTTQKREAVARSPSDGATLLTEPAYAKTALTPCFTTQKPSSPQECLVWLRLWREKRSRCESHTKHTLGLRENSKVRHDTVYSHFIHFVQRARWDGLSQASGSERATVFRARYCAMVGSYDFFRW